MTTVYTITVDARGLTEESILVEARSEASLFFGVPYSQTTAEILSLDIGGGAVVRVDKTSGTLLG